MYKNSDARERVLATVQHKAIASVEDVASDLGIVPVTARTHLNALVQQGLLRTTLDRGHVGRPRLRFSPTEKAERLLPNRYAAFAVDILGSLAALAGQRGLERVLDAAAAKYASANRQPAELSLPERVERLTALIEQESGEASNERTSTGFAIHQPKCPYAEIAREHSAVCRYHLHAISKLLGEQVTLEQSLLNGDQECVFAVTERRLLPVGVRMVSDGRVRPA